MDQPEAKDNRTVIDAILEYGPVYFEFLKRLQAGAIAEPYETIKELVGDNADQVYVAWLAMHENLTLLVKAITISRIKDKFNSKGVEGITEAEVNILAQLVLEMKEAKEKANG